MRHLWLLAVAVVMAGAVPAFAVTSTQGGSGLIVIPTVDLTPSSGVFLINGKVTSHTGYGFSGLELGLLNRDGKNYYDAKVQLWPDTTDSELWFPGFAFGVRGLSGSNVNRQYYAVFSKSFTFPKSVISLGIAKADSWSHGIKKWFYGIEVPILPSFTLLADRDGFTSATNAGARYMIGKTYCIYDYFQDVFHRVPGSNGQNVIGACYQNQF